MITNIKRELSADDSRPKDTKRNFLLNLIVCVRISMCIKVRGLPYSIWISAVELRLSGLGASSFPLWDIWMYHSLAFDSYLVPRFYGSLDLSQNINQNSSSRYFRRHFLLFFYVFHSTLTPLYVVGIFFFFRNKMCERDKGIEFIIH